VIQANKEGGGGGAAAAASAASTALSKAEATLVTLTNSGAPQADIDAAKAAVENAKAEVAKANASGNPPVVAPTKINNINEIKPPVGGVDNSTYEMGPTEFIDQGKQLLVKLGTANTDLLTLNNSVTSNGLISTSIPALETAQTAVDAANAAKNEIITESTRAGNIAAAIATGGLSAIKLAPKAIDAYTKIEAAVAAVAAAQQPVKDAIAAKNAGKPADDPAAKIQALTDKLKKDAEGVLAAAKTAYKAILPTPTPPVDFATEDGLIATANAAILAATNADATGKDAAIAKASAAVDAAIAAANNAKDDVAAKNPPPPPPATGTNYVAYKAAYTAYDAAKKSYEAALSAAQQLQKDSVTPGASGVPPTQPQIVEAKAKLKLALDSLTSSMTTGTSLVNISSPTSMLDNKKYEDLDSVSKTKEVDGLISNTDTYSQSLRQIQGARAIYEAEIKPKSPDPATENDYAAYQREYEKYGEAKREFDQALQEAQAIYSNPGIRATNEIKQAKSVLKQAVEAISPPVIGIIDKSAFNDLTDNTARQAEITKVTQATAKYKTDNALIDTYIATYNSDVAKAKPAMEPEPEEEEAGGFSLFDGGSKPKSKSSRSKSSSKSSSSPKNKTKKNHSKSKSNKSKTPKIIMNE